MCVDWLDYDRFKIWSIAHGYRDDLELGRLDKTKDYTPDNCEWMSHAANMQLRRIPQKSVKKGTTDV